MSNWQPLESNSETITNYMASIGLDVTAYSFQDLLSYEPWAQEMINRPVLGLLFIYEITDKQEKFRKEQEEILAKADQKVAPSLFYMHQYAENACGTIGCFHIVGNLEGEFKKLIKTDSLLDTFYKKVQGKNAEEIGKIFNGSEDLKEKHVEASEQGATNVSDHLSTANHFIAFVQKEGVLYELDGRKNRPINHGPTTAETFLEDACLKAHEFIQREPDNVNAGLMVLARRPAEEEN